MVWRIVPGTDQWINITQCLAVSIRQAMQAVDDTTVERKYFLNFFSQGLSYESAPIFATHDEATAALQAMGIYDARPLLPTFKAVE